MVSVIIPTYNYAAYIGQTLDSLLNQTYENWECIVVDDGSSDDTRSVVEAYCKKDARIQYHFQENKGVSAARNLGLKKAKGSYIQFLDGDDLLQSNKLLKHVECLEKHSEYDMVYGEVRYFSDDNIKDMRYSLNNHNETDWVPKLSGKGKLWLKELSKKNVFVIHAPLFRKKILDQIDLFDSRMKALEDWDFWMRLALKNFYIHFETADNTFALVRAHAGSLSTHKRSMTEGHLLFLYKQSKQQKGLAFQAILLLKYLEVFWNSIFLEGKLWNVSIIRTLLCFVLLPVYLLIKIVRLVK